jgi:hypothetical protein
VQILNSVVRHFQYGIGSTNGSPLLIEDTVVSDNSLIGIDLFYGNATLNRVAAHNNQNGITLEGTGNMALQNVAISNNRNVGLTANGAPGSTTVIRLTKSVIAGNQTSISTPNGGYIWSYGDNVIADNINNVMPLKLPLN